MTKTSKRLLIALVAGGVLLAPSAALGRESDPLRITRPVQVTKQDLDPRRTYSAPYLLADPDDPEVIVGGTIEFRRKQCTLVRSTDGGETWRVLDNPPSLASYPFCLANNSNIFQAPLAWGSGGTLYMATVGWDVQDTRRKTSVVLHRTDDLGDSWTSSMVRDARPTDGENQESNRPVTGVVVDTSGESDVVYVTWRQGLQNQPSGSSSPSQAMVAVSKDGGRSFGEPVKLVGNHFEDGAVRSRAITTGTTIPGTTTTTAPPGSLAEQPNQAANFGSGNNGVAISDDGTFYAAWPSTASNQGGTRVPAGLFLTTSHDEGSTFTVSEIRSFSHDIEGNVQLAWGSEGGAEGTLHLVYEGTPDPGINSAADIWYQRSTDGGRTWTEPKVLNDDDPAEFNGQYVPFVRTAPNGRVDVAWWDTRDDPGIRANDVYYTYSEDNGETWAANVRITDQTIDRRFGVWGNNFDQNSPPGIASLDEYAMVAWDDTRFSRGEDGPVLAPDPARGDEGVGGGLQDIFVSSVQFSAVGGGASRLVKVILAGIAGVVVVGLILTLVATMSRSSEGERHVRPSKKAPADVH